MVLLCVMDDDFLKELDEYVSNVGMDKVWERQIGAYKVLISPLSITAQAKVNETMSNEDLGVNAIGETKRIALANAIVGIGDFDLRKYRDAGPVFKIPKKDPKNPKKPYIKVDLAKYIYMKMADWGNDWIDTAFEVFSDLMESLSKEHKKGVKFENIEDPHDELIRIEARAAELREQLGMPPAVEAEEQPPTPKEVQKAYKEVKEEADERGIDLDEFDPFETVSNTEEAQEEASQPPVFQHVFEPLAEQSPDPSPPKPPIVEKPPMLQTHTVAPTAVETLPTPNPSKLTPIQRAVNHRTQQLNISAKESSIENPINPMPSVSSNVVEEKIDRPKKPVNVDKRPRQSQNPRFRPPR